MDKLHTASKKLVLVSNERNELEEKLSNKTRELRKKLESKETMLSQTSSTLRTREAECQQLHSDLRAIQSLHGGLEAKMKHTIQEANQTKQELSSKVITQEQALTKSMAEADASRVIQEELEDKSKRSLDRAIQSETKFAALENEYTRLRRSLNRRDIEKGAELDALKTSLQQAKVEQQETQSALSDVKAKLHRADRDRVRAERDLSTMRGIEDENRRLTAELVELQYSFDAAKSHSIETACLAKGLQEQFNQLSVENQAKQDRIKWLERRKLTTEYAEKVKKLKVSAFSFVVNSCILFDSRYSRQVFLI